MHCVGNESSEKNPIEKSCCAYFCKETMKVNLNIFCQGEMETPSPDGAGGLV